MSRQQKLHKPLNADFNRILAAVGIGQGKAKKAALSASKRKAGNKSKAK
jgi:hypothetical protein